MAQSKTRRSILVRGTNWIGDSVLSLAALRELRRLFPDDHLAILVKEWVAGVFEDPELVDEVIVLDNNQRCLRSIRSNQLWRFDQAILFQNAFEAALLTFLSRIPERVGYSTDWRGLLLTRSARPRIKPLGRHQVYYYLDLLYQTKVSPVDYLASSEFQPNIRLKASERGLERRREVLHRRGVKPDAPLIGLNPGAYFGSAKRWLTDRYASLADRFVSELGAEVLIFGSRNEQGIAEEIESYMSHQPRILAGQTDLSTLIALVSSCALFVTNDSGPMHLAAALDIPQIAIFGSTDEVATGPFSSKAKVIHKHVDCSPCLLRECPTDLRCFNRIEVDEVFQTAKEMLSV
jgi:heptosyltransferase-2